MIMMNTNNSGIDFSAGYRLGYLTEAFFEPLSGFAYEGQELIFRHLNDGDPLTLSFGHELCRRMMLGDEECLWKFVFVRLALLKHSLGIKPGQFTHA